MTKRIPSLDGLRAISIVFVMIGHVCGTQNFFLKTPFILDRYANFGVRVFFVISGFLITTLLLQEQASTGKIGLVAFYRRRLFRIFPAAYAYITIVMLLAWNSLSALSIIQAYSYTTNYAGQKPWLFGHLWSLSVEEQFYLLWPAVLILFFRHRLAISLGTVILAPAVRLAALYMGYERVGEYFPTVADALAIGCLLAIVKPAIDKRAAWFTPFRMACVAAVTLVLPYFADHTRLFVFGVSLLQLGIALCIYYAIRQEFRILNGRIISWIGTLSYSLYLWQQVFLNRNSQAFWTAFPLNIVFALLAACASFYFIEQPFLALGRRTATKPAPPKHATATA